MQTTVTDMIASYLEAMATQLTQLLPWMKHLNENERVELLADLSHACVQVRQTGQADVIVEVLEDWEATARCVGNDEVLQRLRAPTTAQDYTPWDRIRVDVSGETAS